MSHVPIPPPTQDELQDIRDSDEAAGEDLRFAPLAWMHRRQLLAHIDLADEQYRMALRLVTPTPETVATALATETDPPTVIMAPPKPYSFVTFGGVIHENCLQGALPSVTGSYLDSAKSWEDV